MIIIPLTNDGARSIDVDIGGGRGVFTFRSYWNYTTSTWNLDIYDSAGNAVLLGLALVIGIDILSAHPAASRRMGELRVFSTSVNNNRTVDDLGETAFLTSFTEGEFESLFPMPDFLPFQVVDIEDVLQ